jgi:hypothetical protein
MSTQPLPTILDLAPPSSPLLPAVLSHLRKHTSLSTTNHSIRPVYFMLLFARKVPPFKAAVSAGAINLETAMLALLMHDLGWATTKELLSKDKRFEVDGAELAVKFIQEQIHDSHTTDREWNKARLEELWTAIALHTTPSIGRHHPNPTITLVQLSIMSDFTGPHLPPPFTEIISVDEYKAIVKHFPREGFKKEVVEIMCGLCREKPETTYDNFVSEFGKKFGLDGTGEGKEEFRKQCEETNLVARLMAGLEACAQYDGE